MHILATPFGQNSEYSVTEQGPVKENEQVFTTKNGKVSISVTGKPD